MSSIGNWNEGDPRTNGTYGLIDQSYGASMDQLYPQLVAMFKQQNLAQEAQNRARGIQNTGLGANNNALLAGQQQNAARSEALQRVIEATNAKLAANEATTNRNYGVFQQENQAGLEFLYRPKQSGMQQATNLLATAAGAYMGRSPMSSVPEVNGGGGGGYTATNFNTSNVLPFGSSKTGQYSGNPYAPKNGTYWG